MERDIKVYRGDGKEIQFIQAEGAELAKVPEYAPLVWEVSPATEAIQETFEVNKEGEK